MDHLYDMLIVGGGPAGYTAALYAARAGLDVAVVERMSAGGQMALTDVIDNYPGFEEGVDGFTLGMKMQASAERFGAKSLFGDVLSAKLDGVVKELVTDGGTLYAKTVVIATGANPRALGIANEESLVGRGLHYCAHCDGRFYKDKTVLVVGGGNSAAADALYLSRLAKHVIVVHRRDTLRATKIYHAPLMEAENVTFLWNSRVTDWLTADGRLSGAVVENVQTGKKEEVTVDGAFVSIGRQPATEWLNHSLPLDDYGYVIADESTRTAIDGVYAIGDVRTKALRQVVTAVGDGAVAVHYAEEYLATSESL